MFRFAAIVVLGFACSAPPAPKPVVAAPPPVETPKPVVAPPVPTPPGLRLPAGVRPTRYALELTIDPAADTFTGRVTIAVAFDQPTNVIWLHGAALTVKSAWINGLGARVAATVITPTPKTPDNEEYIGFSFDGSMGTHSTELEIEYTGKIASNDSDGIYKVEDRGTWYVYTQFEATTARRAFPCFDEPSFKVPLQLTMHVKSDHVAVANTPMVSEKPTADGMKTVTFAPTKPLPTYLIALAVGPFEIVDGGKAGKNNIPLRVIAPKGRTGEAGYATKVTPDIINALEAYFGSPYPYEKLDQIAVPRKGGAMENAGLVTYGLPLLLIPTDEESINRKKRFLSVAAHELAHHWFGDYVTLAWWNDIWLNESFASWMENKIVGTLEPKWGTDVSLVNRRSGAMDGDALATARKIRQPIETRHDIGAAFDGITYGKGSSILAMLERWIGADKFQKGLRRYFEKHAHGIATTADFLAAISADAGIDVSPVFSSFLDQVGTPLISAELDCKGDAPKLHLAQQRYLPIGSKAASEQTWNVPVCVRYQTGTGEERTCTVMSAQKTELVLANAKTCPRWVLANDGQLGYYRVHYSGDMLTKLLAVKSLTMPERIGLLGDLSALVESGHVPVGKALERVPALAKDTNRHMTSAMSELMGFITGDVVPKELRPNRARFVRKMLLGRARAVGWAPTKGEDDDTRQMRPSLLSWVANTGEDPDFIKTAKKMTDKWMADHKAVDPELVGLVLHIAARNGDRALFDKFRAAAKTEKERKDRNHLLSAMGGFRKPEIVKVAMAISLTDEFEPRDSIGLVWGAFGHEDTRELAYQFVKTNLDALLAKLPRDSGAGFVGIGSSFCDAAHRDDSMAFFKDKAPTYLGGPRAMARMIERTDLCIARRAAYKPSVVEFLKKQ